ncbi:hypothetical protein CL673_06475 [Candidatus Bathyarchaeota archaeon]|nr:hypothetical protein [Candidatus Bathyarchaeota archaeon]
MHTPNNRLRSLSDDIQEKEAGDRNGDLTPDQITLGSRRKVWWRCGRGHESSGLYVSISKKILLILLCYP